MSFDTCDCDECEWDRQFDKDWVPLKARENPGPQPGREDVNLTELSEDKRDAIRAILAGRSVIYRCRIKGAKITTTYGYAIIGNTMTDVEINAEPQIISGNELALTKVGQTIGSRITRNVMK